MDQLQRVTAPTMDVLRVLLAASEPVWGLRIIRESGRAPGTVYPALERLEDAGWLTSMWETDEGRPGPRRRYYNLTADGAVAAVRVIARFEARAKNAARTVTRTA